MTRKTCSKGREKSRKKSNSCRPWQKTRRVHFLIPRPAIKFSYLLLMKTQNKNQLRKKKIVID